MKKLMIMLSVLLIVSCHSVKKTTTETTITKTVKPWTKDFDLKAKVLIPGTGLHISGLPVLTDDSGRAEMAAKTFKNGNITTTAKIKDGKLDIDIATADSMHIITGKATVSGADTLTNKETVTVKEYAPSVWESIKFYIRFIVIAGAVILVFIIFERDKDDKDSDKK